MIESYIHGKDWKEDLQGFREEFDRLFEEEKEEYGDIPSDLEKIMEGYIRRWKDNPINYFEVEGKKAEIEFEVNLREGIVFKGKVDGVEKDHKNRLWIVERKTFKSMPSEDIRFSNLQSALYCWGMSHKLGVNFYGVLWDYIRAKPPTKPKILKSGGLSKRKNIDTDRHTYLETIKENGLDPNDYQDMLEMLEEKGGNFFRRIYLPVSKELIDNLVQDLRITALEINELETISKEKNLTWMCNPGGCQYHSLCKAELHGLDTNYLIKADYKERRKDSGQEEKEEG